MVFLLLKSGFMAGQGDQCPKFRIGVSVGEIYKADTTVVWLNKKHNKNLSASEWISEIESEIFKELNLAGYDDLEFFSLKSNPDAEMDFRFTFNLMPWSVDGNETIPGYDFTYIDPDYGREVTIFRSPVYDRETAFRMSSSLTNCATCLPLMSYYLSIEFAVNTDIYKLIKSQIHFYNWPLDKIINDWEVRHPAPAREPQMEVRYEKEYLSLLDEESRKMEVYIKVKNCHGDYVYNKFHSQPVYFLKEMDRLEFKNTLKCLDGPTWGIFATIYTNKDYEAVGKYIIKQGFEPSIENPRFKTCGIGNGSMIELEGEIKVLGLELEVEPDRKVIHNGEQTSIQIDLHELDPDGTEILSCAGKEVDVKVTGLVDGKVSHESGMITLNEVGVAFIDYKAGQKDRQIKITATFTPPKYPEELKAEATITVKQFEYDATLTIKASYNKTENSSSKEANGWGYSERTHDLNESCEALVYVPLKMENAYDVEAQNLRYEYYRPLDINLSSFNASFRSKDYNSNIGSDEGGKTTILKHKIPSDQKISLKETLLQLYIVMTLDMKTDKVMKINIDGFNVEFTWKETVDSHHESWWKPPPSPGHETIDKTETDTEEDTFCACPVEDPIPDPIIKSSTESIKKYLKDLGVALPENAEVHEEEEIPIIEPDLLVKFGDGTTFFGGEGRKVVDESKGSSVRRKEMTFTWHVTRKKKAL